MKKTMVGLLLISISGIAFSMEKSENEVGAFIRVEKKYNKIKKRLPRLNLGRQRVTVNIKNLSYTQKIKILKRRFEKPLFINFNKAKKAKGFQHRNVEEVVTRENNIRKEFMKTLPRQERVRVEVEMIKEKERLLRHASRSFDSDTSLGSSDSLGGCSDDDFNSEY